MKTIQGCQSKESFISSMGGMQYNAMQCNEEATTEVGVLAWHFSSFPFVQTLTNCVLVCLELLLLLPPVVFRFEGMVTMSTKP